MSRKETVTHGAFIDALGGPAFLSAFIKEKKGAKRAPTPQAISMWKNDGCAWRHRPLLAELAKSRGVNLPANFLDMDTVN